MYYFRDIANNWGFSQYWISAPVPFLHLCTPLSPSLAAVLGPLAAALGPLAAALGPLAYSSHSVRPPIL